MGLGIVILLAALPALRVETSGELPCELASRLPAAVAEQKLTVDAQSANRLIVASVGESVVVRLIDGAGKELGWRTLRPTQKDCAVLPKTIVLLARTWLSVTPSPPVGERAGVRGREEPEEPKADAGVPETAKPVVVVEKPKPVEERKPEPSVVETPAVPAPRPRPIEPLPPAPVLVVEVEDAGESDAGSFDSGFVDAGTGPSDAGLPDAGGLTPPLSPQGERELSVAALAGVSLDLARPAAQFAISADWTFLGPLGIALELGGETPRRVATPPGNITAQSYYAGLSATGSFLDRLHVSFGLRLFVHPLSTENFTTGANQVLPAGAFFASVEYRQPIFRSLFLLVRAGGQARFIGADVVNDTLVFPRWSFIGQAGLGLKL